MPKDCLSFSHARRRRQDTQAMLVLDTERLRLRWFRAGDADTVLALLNDPDWLRNIGDRAVRTREQALAFIAERLVEPCWRHGFGHWAVEIGRASCRERV